MTTRVYGASDDLIEFDGDFSGEVGHYGSDEEDRGVLVVMSDGTHLEVKYGKGDLGIWGVTLLRRGELFLDIDQCVDEDAPTHSDVARFGDGITGAVAATEWQRVK